MARVASLVPVRRGEGRPAALLSAVMFLTFAGLGAGAPGVESLFLTRLGARYLPYLYVALGAVTIGVTVLISTVFGRLRRRSLYQALPLALAAWLLAARLLIGLDLRWAYAPIFLSVYVLFTLQNLFAFGAAALVFDARQAKRLFPLFAAAGISGRALGGFSAGAWARLIGSDNLLFLWAGALALSFLGVRLATAGAPPDAGRVGRPGAAGRASSRTLPEGLRYVMGSRLLRLLALAAMLVGTIYFLVVYPFSGSAAVAFPDPQRLAGFLGLFQGLTTGLAFVASALLANRFYARFGLMAGMAGMTVIYLAGFAGLIAAPGFAALAVFRLFELSWLYGFSSTALQAVFNILPADRREPSRLVVDGVFRQIGISAAGAFLLAADRWLVPGPAGLVRLALVGLPLSAAAVAVILRARAAYAGALADALRAGRPAVFFTEEAPFGGLQRDPAAVSSLIGALRDGEPHTRRIAAEILGHVEAKRSAPSLVQALRDPDAGVRVAALGALTRAGAADAALEVSALLHDPAAEVRREAALQLGRLAGYPLGLRERLRPLLQDAEPAVRAAAASVLVGPGQDCGDGAFGVLRQMTRAPSPEHRQLALRALEQGLEGPAGGEACREQAHALAAERLADSAAAVRRSALEAVSRIDPLGSLEDLATALADEEPSVADAAAQRLGELAAQNGGAGPHAPAREMLLQALQDPLREAGALRGLERLPAHPDTALLRGYALGKLEQARRYARLAADVPGLEDQGVDPTRRALLAAALERGRRTQAALALRAAGLLKAPERVRLALEHLASPEAALRAGALEMIDALGEREITREVIAAFEPESDRTGKGGGRRLAERAKRVPLPELLRDPDPWVRACAAWAAAAVPPAGRNGLTDELARLAADPDPLVQDTARRAAHDGEDKTMEDVQRLSLMERLLLLQSVPLFAELPPAELKQVAAVCFETRFADRERIAAQGEPGEEMFVIVSGEVRIVAEQEGGGERELARRGPGEHIGEMAILSGAPRMAGMVAAGPVHLLGIARREFEQILRQRPETSLAVMRALCARLQEAQGRAAPVAEPAAC